MLVLTRKIEEQIRIGNDITISILRVKGNTVRVGIDAPRSIRVVRGELSAHANDEAPARIQETFDVEMPADLPGQEEPSVGGMETPDPATTAVRQFIANRARRSDRRTKSHRPGSTSLATALTRSA